MVLQLLDATTMAPSCRMLPARPLPPKNARFLSNGLLSDENPRSLSPVLFPFSYSEKLLKANLCCCLKAAFIVFSERK